MLKRPYGLERLVEYSVHSKIPVEFAEAVDVLRPQVLGDINSGRIQGDPNLETASRLFRLGHPFKHALQAEYALYLGKSVGLVRSLSAYDPESVEGSYVYCRISLGLHLQGVKLLFFY